MKKELLTILAVILPTIYIISFFHGMNDANFRYIGYCKKSSTYLFHYTGIAQVYDLGCKLGRRIDEEK
jgi:hypothetical protein